MAIDSSIALGVRPIEVQSPLAMAGQFAQLQNASNQNALAQYQLSSAQRADASENALNEAVRSSVDPLTGKIDTNKLQGLMAKGGVGGSKMFAVNKLIADQDAAALTRDKTTGEIAAQKQVAVDTELKRSREFLSTINPDSPEAPAQYMAWHQANHSNPILGPLLASRGVTPEQTQATIAQAMKTPGGFQDLLRKSMFGIEKFAELNKPSNVSQNLNGAQQIMSVPGLGGRATVVPNSLVADVPLPADVEAQKARIALAGRAPRAEAQPTAPVAVVGADGKVVLVSREEAIGGRMTPAAAMEGVTPKQKQVLEVKYPAATLAVKSVETGAEKLATDMEKLARLPGLPGISGLISGRTPAITADARQAEALYKSIVARGGFKELEAMRSASSTGGALGNVSNQEGQYLRDAFGALSLTQDPVDLARALKDTATKTRDAAKRVREVYDMTYEYKNQGAPAAAPGAPVRAPGGPVPVPSINSNASAPPAPGGGATGSWSIVR